MKHIRRIKETATHIRLINATAEHAPVLFEIFTGINTIKYSPVSKASVEELSFRLEQSGESFSKPAKFYRFFGEYDATIFGTFIIKNIKWHRQEAEIGFSLLDKWQGQGLGSALVYKCISKIFSESTIERIWATVSTTNDSCQHLMHSLGFDNCGFYQESLIINGEPVKQILF